MPAGDLRDNRKSADRAEVIVVTKCNNNLAEEEKDIILKELNPRPNQKVIFYRSFVYPALSLF
jgi:tetraacyldisaccharide 4'-kinase